MDRRRFLKQMGYGLASGSAPPGQECDTCQACISTCPEDALYLTVGKKP